MSEELRKQVAKEMRDFNADEIIIGMQEVRKQRKAQYNPRVSPVNEVVHGFRQIGRGWSALLSQHLGIEVPDLPASLVCELLASLKVWRAVTNPDLDDSYEDLMNYGGPLAWECAHYEMVERHLLEQLAKPKQATADDSNKNDRTSDVQGVRENVSPSVGLRQQPGGPGTGNSRPEKTVGWEDGNRI